jgi:hypothetical protein
MCLHCEFAYIDLEVTTPLYRLCPLWEIRQICHRVEWRKLSSSAGDRRQEISFTALQTEFPGRGRFQGSSEGQ